MSLYCSQDVIIVKLKTMNPLKILFLINFPNLNECNLYFYNLSGTNTLELVQR